MTGTSRSEQRAARALMTQVEIKYTHALRLVRESIQKEKDTGRPMEDVLREKMSMLGMETK